MALVVATLFLAMALLILSALGTRVISAHRQTDNYVAYERCFSGLESGYARVMAELETGGTGAVGIGTWTRPATPTRMEPPSFTANANQIAPVSLATMPRVQYMGYAWNWVNDGLDNNGNGQIDELAENGYFTVYALSRHKGVVRRVEAVTAGRDVSVWRNVVFAGNGQAGGLINGNVSIHGSVHLLGGSLPTGGTAITAMDLSGTSLIHNNYAGVPVDLQNRVPALPTRSFGGENVSTLNAILRVKRGLVGMSGNSEIGEPNVAGNTFKETMDGTFVNDGWTGNAVTPDGGRGIPKSVFSDNGWDNTYDLGDRMSLPVLSDHYRDMTTGDRVINPATGSYYTHAEYFRSLAGTPYPGNLTIQANQDFYYNATRPAETNPALRLPTDDFILFNATTNRMTVNGQVEINGNLSLQRGSGSDDTISYSGRAAVLVNGDVALDTHVLTINSNGTTALSFPVNNVLGIMARNNMTVGSNAQLQLMGAFYAQGTVSSSKQTTTMGTFVGNYFNMGTNVPNIYQVPALPDNLPIGMIGAYPVLTYSQVSWRELGA